MKTYEEMARDVLRRRDEQLESITQTSQLQSQINPPPEVVYPAAPKKRGKLGLLPKIAIPCAAAVLVGVVGFTAWKNLHRGRFINPGLAEGDQSGIADDDESKLQYIFNEFDSTPTHTAAEQRESIYKGGKTEIYINEAEYMNVYHLPLLSAEDFSPIDDDKINGYYGLEFDRLSRVYPEWKSEHEPFGTYAHDEDDGFVASHRIIHTTNSIHYTFESSEISKISRVDVAASITPTYDSAEVENAKPSVINGFDAMLYHFTDVGLVEYAADIDMGIARVTITTTGMDEEEFLNILDVYTAPDKNSEDNQNNNQNQTMEDKIVILDEAPVYVNVKSWPYRLETYENLVNLESCEHIRYSMSELNDFYGINFGCMSELHPDWLKMYNDRSLGVYVEDYDDIQTENMAVSGGRAILWTENSLGYQTDNGVQILISARWSTLPEEEIGSSVVNGYNAAIFQESGNSGVWGYGAAIQIDDTLVFITATATNMSEDEFIDLLREYTSEASKYKRSSKPLTTENKDTTFKAVDIVDSRITYDVDWDVKSCWWSHEYTEDFDVVSLLGKTEDSEASLGYLREFFGTDKLPVKKQFENNFEREMYNGVFNCSVNEGAKAYTPVDGTVVATCYGWYNSGLGNAVAVEFGDGKIFIIGHLDEVNVEVGDSVKAGQVLGVCGCSGAVFFEEDPTMLSLIAMKKTD